MATGFSRSSDRPRGRAVAARQLEEFMLSGADSARDWDEPPSRYEGRDRDVDELVLGFGGTKQLAEAAGVTRRTVQRWQQSGTENITRRGREALAKANQQLNAVERREHGRREWGDLVNRFGGTQSLADAAGVHRRTVQKWMSGAAVPSDASLARLQRTDRGYRLAQTYGDLGSRPDAPAPPNRVHMKAAGMVHAGAQGAKLSPLYQYNRQIGIASLDERGHELPPEVVQDIFGAMQAGNTTGALDALQEHLSGARDDDPWGYAQVGGYSVEQDIGFFIDDFSEFTLN